MSNTAQRKKKKKYGKLVGLAALIAVILSLLIIYRVLIGQETPPADTGSTDTDVTMIVNRKPSEITSLTYSRGETEYTFTCHTATGVWSYAADTAFPLNQTPVSTMASAVAAIGVYRELGEDTGVYGFAEPVLTFSVTYADGAALSYAVGDLNSATGYRYLKDVDAGLVYTIAPTLLDYFSYTLEDMLLFDTLPTYIEPDYITSVTLHADGEEKAITDEAGVTALYELFTTLAPSEYADWSADEDEMAAFGIGSLTMTIDYKRTAAVADESSATSSSRVPASYTVRFGDTTEDGKVYYTLGKSDIVYLIYAEQVDKILEYLNYTPADTEAASEAAE